MSITQEKIEKEVVEALCRSLALDQEQIKKHSRLVTDLDMDSLDFLDIMFSLESKFQLKIRDDDFDRILRPDKSEATLEEEYLTQEEIDRLAPVMPSLKEEGRKGRIPRREFFSFVTVETLTRMVSRKILQGNP